MVESSQDPHQKPPTSEAQTQTSPRYDGEAGALFRIVLVNALLNIVTLGTYRFWAKTRVRLYLRSHIAFHDEPLEYTGQGRELFFGFLIALGVFIPLVVVFQLVEIYVATQGPVFESAVSVLYAATLFFLIEVAIYRARRYQLSRTLWRGIRGGQTGSALGYAFTALGYGVLTVATLGLALPLMNTRLRRYKTTNTWFGDRRFRFEARMRELFPRWIACWLLFLPSLGLSYFWFRAAQFRCFAKWTTFGNLRLASTMSGGRLLGIFLPYVLALIALSLGPVIFVFLVGDEVVALVQGLVVDLFGNTPDAPQNMMAVAAVIITLLVLFILLPAIGIAYTLLVIHRLIGYVCRTLTVIGEEDFDAIAQNQQQIPRYGEGLADVLGVGGL